MKIVKFNSFLLFQTSDEYIVMKTLQSSAVQDPNAAKSDIKAVQDAFEIILDWNGANDILTKFYDMGGFQDLKNCLRSPHNDIRCRSANVIAE